MKKIYSILLVAAAAMAVFSCQKQETIAPEVSSEEFTLTFTSEKPAFDDQTKTEWTGETIQWSVGDKISVAYTVADKWQNESGDTSNDAKLYKSEALKEAEASGVAQFNVSASFKGTTEGTHVFYGVYPAPTETGFSKAPIASLTVPATQTPKSDSFDPTADLMVGVSGEYDARPASDEKISLLWNRLVAHAVITLKNINGFTEGETISSITLTAQEGANLVGNQNVNLITKEVVKNNNASNVVEIAGSNLSAENGTVSFWACMLPETLTSLTVEVETSKATYTRAIDLSANQKTFVKNARNTLGINMATAEREAKAAAALPFVRDFSDKTGETSITELDGFRVNGSVYNAAGAIRLAKGEGEGSITTQLLDLSQDFQVRVTAKGWDSDELTLSVSAGDQSEDVTLIAEDYVTYAVNFNAVSATSDVTFTAASGKRCYISRIEILTGHDELPPVLKATAPSQMAAEGGESSFAYTLINPKAGQEITATSNVGWISGITVGDGTVTYTVAANETEEAREGVITLSYDGIDDVAVTISQAADGVGVSKTARITFGSNNVKINSSPVVALDSEGNSWTITTEGTTSYTSKSDYYQVGSSSKPATSITFTTTLPEGVSISNISSKFGGFSGTGGNITLKIGDSIVGTGVLNASNDVEVNSTSTASGNTVTVTVTDIAKGVKCYYISLTYAN